MDCGCSCGQASLYHPLSLSQIKDYSILSFQSGLTMLLRLTFNPTQLSACQLIKQKLWEGSPLQTTNVWNLGFELLWGKPLACFCGSLWEIWEFHVTHTPGWPPLHHSFYLGPIQLFNNTAPKRICCKSKNREIIY